MMIINTTPSMSYFMWLKRIVGKHLSKAWETETTERQEREEEVLNDLWTEVDDAQKQRLWGLSSDLNTLRDNETWVEADWPPMSKAELGRAQMDAYQRQDWDGLLELLRRPPRFHPRNMVDYLRGRAWLGLGHPEVALLFFNNAARLAPDNPSYLVLALECMKELEDFSELLKHCQSHLQSPNSHPRLLFRVADGFHFYAKRSADKQYDELAVAAVDRGIERLAQLGWLEDKPSFVAAAYVTKSLCLTRLGRPEQALAVLNEAVTIFPDSTTLLTARGMLKRELGRDDAIDDLQSAASLGPVIAWAYAELARDALLHRRNQAALKFCQQGISVARHDAATAYLRELEAIAMARLHQPPDAVRTAFQHARELNPLNEETRLNSERFETFQANPDSAEPEWGLVALPASTGIEELDDVFAAA